MKTIRILVILTALLIIGIINSCIPSEPCNGGIYKTTKMNAGLVELENVVSCDQRPKGIRGLNNNDECYYKKVCITMFFLKEHISGSSCGGTFFSDSIEKLIIKSNNDYNQNYKKKK